MSTIHDIVNRINERYVGSFNARNLIVVTVIASLAVIGIEFVLF